MPYQAARALESREQPDRGIAASWARFQDSDEDILFATDGVAKVGDFPAWMLLHEPGLALQLPVDLPVGSTLGELHYQQVHRWIHARRAERHDEELELRKALKTSSAFLFHCLMRTVSV